MDFAKDSFDILIVKVKDVLTSKCRTTGDKPTYSIHDIRDERTGTTKWLCNFYVDNPEHSLDSEGVLIFEQHCVNGVCKAISVSYTIKNRWPQLIAYISTGFGTLYATPEMASVNTKCAGESISALVKIIGAFRFERIICALNETIPIDIDYSTDFDPDLQDFYECRKRFAHELRVWANCYNECLMPIYTPFELSLNRNVCIWYERYPARAKFVLKHEQDHETLDVYKCDATGNEQRKLTDCEVLRAFGSHFHDEIVSMFKDIEKRKKKSVDNTFIGAKVSFGDKAPKKWVDLYNLLYDHFAHWCHRVDATLQQKSFSYSSKSWYPSGINFYIMKRNSVDGKDKLKFSVFYDESTEQVTMRFFAENVNIVVDGHNVHECCYCEPIISVFVFDKPKDGVKMFDITNGDTDNKMENDWRPLDVLKVYFGDKFWDNIIEIFGKFIPKQTAIFYENILKRWNSDPEYKVFEYIRQSFNKFIRTWTLNGCVKQVVKSINAVDWEVMFTDNILATETNSSRKYRIELRHLIAVKATDGISDNRLAFYKIDPIRGARRIIPYGLDHEFGNGFSAHVESIYYQARMKIKEFVKEDTKMTTNDTKKEFDEIAKALATLGQTLKLEVQGDKTAEPKYPHFSTDKNGQKLVTIPMDVYRTMANTQYGMSCVMLKDRRTEIKDAYWNPKTGVTTILWADGSKTMSKPMEGTTADPEIGFALCIAKKFMGGTQNKWRKWVKKTVDASEASAKKKLDKSRIKLEKQARARWFEQQILDPTPDQIETMIGIIKKENAKDSKAREASVTAKAEDTATTESPKKPRRPRQKKSTKTK